MAFEIIAGQISPGNGSFTISSKHKLQLQINEQEYKGKNALLVPVLDLNYGWIFKMLLEENTDKPIRWYYPDRKTKNW